MGKMLDDMKAFMDSEEGQKKIDEWVLKMKKEDELAEKWVERFNDYLESLTDAKVKKVMNKFVKREIKYGDMWYDRGVLTYSNLMNTLFDSARSYGTSLDDYENFLSARYEYQGYVFSLYQGQGSIIGITYKGKRIF